jgi:hypothetical protein
VKLVEHCKQEITDATDTSMEAIYIQYKVGGALLAAVLEKYDEAMLVHDLQTLKT